MLKRLLATCLTVGVMTAALAAQEKAAAPKPVPGTAPAPSMGDVMKRRNVNIDIAITDQTGTAEPAKKVVTMIVTDRQMGSVRSTGNVAGQRHAMEPFATLNVDATPWVHSDDSILLKLTLEYVPRPEDGSDAVKRSAPAQLKEQMAVTLESGKPMMISRAADPGSNRKVTVEVTATVMK